MKNKSIASLSTLIVLTCIVASFLLVGCKTTLAPDGVYQNDQFLYTTDATLKLQQNALRTFVKWEYDNRQVITNEWPKVTVMADKVRAEAPKWFALVGVARADYIAVRQMAGGLTNSPALDTAKANVNLHLAVVWQKVADAQTAINETTLATKPTLDPNTP